MAWLEFCNKRPISIAKGNFKLGGMIRPLQGLVLHIEQGTEDGTFGWFNTSKAERQAAFDWQGLNITAYESSAHFGNPKNGQLEQFVDTDNQAYAQGPGNATWLSVENEGMPGDELTLNQINNLAQLMAYLNFNEGVPLVEANDPSETGLGFHSMAASWGHPGCPGDAVIGQRGIILEVAKGLLTGRKLGQHIPEWILGWWSVYDTNQYYYYFYRGGEVVYTKTKPASASAPPPVSPANSGTVTLNEHGVDIRWRPLPRSIPTIEKFTRMGWTSTTEMFGTSNKYGGLSATKIV